MHTKDRWNDGYGFGEGSQDKREKPDSLAHRDGNQS